MSLWHNPVATLCLTIEYILFQLVEIDEPETLCKNKSSKFYQLMLSTASSDGVAEDTQEPNEWV